MAFWSCAPELWICSFLIYATQTLTPGNKGQALLLVWCSKMIAQGKVCPWRNLRNLCSEPRGRMPVGFCPKIILRGVQVYNQRIRARVSYAGEKKISSHLGGKFRKLDAKSFFFFFSDSGSRKAAGLYHIPNCWITRGRKHTFYPQADTGLGYYAQLGVLLWKEAVFLFVL